MITFFINLLFKLTLTNLYQLPLSVTKDKKVLNTFVIDVEVKRQIIFVF